MHRHGVLDSGKQGRHGWSHRRSGGIKADAKRFNYGVIKCKYIHTQLTRHHWSMVVGLAVLVSEPFWSSSDGITRSSSWDDYFTGNRLFLHGDRIKRQADKARSH